MLSGRRPGPSCSGKWTTITGSGIRSSLVLCITAVVAGNLLLRSNWNRTWLALSFFPIGVLRNAIRILFIVMMALGYFYVKALTRGDDRRPE